MVASVKTEDPLASLENISLFLYHGDYTPCAVGSHPPIVKVIPLYIRFYKYST